MCMPFCGGVTEGRLSTFVRGCWRNTAVKLASYCAAVGRPWIVAANEDGAKSVPEQPRSETDYDAAGFFSRINPPLYRVCRLHLCSLPSIISTFTDKLTFVHTVGSKGDSKRAKRAPAMITNKEHALAGLKIDLVMLRVRGKSAKVRRDDGA